MASIVMNNVFNESGSEISSETNLYADIANEQLESFGILVDFIPRDYFVSDDVLNEAISYTQVGESFKLPVLFDGGVLDVSTDDNTAFGIVFSDRVTLDVSRMHWASLSVPGRPTGPKEGDLVYIPLAKMLLEVIQQSVKRDNLVQFRNRIYMQIQCRVYNNDLSVLNNTGVQELADLGSLLTNEKATAADNADIEAAKQQIVSDIISDDPFSDW